MAFQVFTFRPEANHKIEYSFLCQSCGKENKAVNHTFHVEYPYNIRIDAATYNKEYKDVNPSNIMSNQNKIAVRRILENRMIETLRDAYLSARKGEYQLFQSTGDVQTLLSNKCLHCNARQEWRKKRKSLFSKEFHEVPSEYLPKINWRFDAIRPEMLSYIEGYIQVMHLNDAEKLPNKEMNKRVTQDKMLRTIDAVTVGMEDWLIKSLVEGINFVEASFIQTIRPPSVPQLQSGELAYGFYGVDHNWWIVVKDRIVHRVIVQ